MVARVAAAEAAGSIQPWPHEVRITSNLESHPHKAHVLSGLQGHRLAKELAVCTVQMDAISRPAKKTACGA